MKKKSTGRGGCRNGAGRPKGSRNRTTLEKEAARELVRQRVIAELGPLIDAQIANAKGISYLAARDKRTERFLRVIEADARVASNEEAIEVWEKDPSVQAFTDLLNRALDKPADKLPDAGGEAAVTKVTYHLRRSED